MAMASLQVLADELCPLVRFGFVDIQDEESLKETFDVKTVPAAFYLLDGVAYEMGALRMTYYQYKTFITE